MWRANDHVLFFLVHWPLVKSGEGEVGFVGGEGEVGLVGWN